MRARMSQAQTPLQRILAQRLIAVVTAPAGDSLVEIARALASGGIDLLAVPAAAPDAANVIADLADDPSIVVGVTDVVSVDQIALAVASGAQFVVCPACERDILSMCRANGLAVIAGGATPAELYAASSLGPDLITVFPAAMLGGPAYLRLLGRTFPGLPIAAAGGLDVDTAPNYLEAGARAVIVDRGLFPDTIEEGSAHIVRMRASALVEVCASISDGRQSRP